MTDIEVLRSRSDSKIWKTVLDALVSLHFNWRPLLLSYYPDLAARAEIATLLHQDDVASAPTVARLAYSTPVLSPPPIAKVLATFSQMSFAIEQYHSVKNQTERDLFVKEVIRHALRLQQLKPKKD